MDNKSNQDNCNEANINQDNCNQDFDNQNNNNNEDNGNIYEKSTQPLDGTSSTMKSSSKQNSQEDTTFKISPTELKESISNPTENSTKENNDGTTIFINECDKFVLEKLDISEESDLNSELISESDLDVDSNSDTTLDHFDIEGKIKLSEMEKLDLNADPLLQILRVENGNFIESVSTDEMSECEDVKNETSKKGKKTIGNFNGSTAYTENNNSDVMDVIEESKTCKDLKIIIPIEEKLLVDSESQKRNKGNNELKR